MQQKNRFRGLVPLLAALVLLVLMLLCSDDAVTGAKRGLSVCAELIIPSLFPFFVLSFLLNDLGLPAYLGRGLEPLMKSLFGVSGAGASAFVIGISGGYPLGASCVADLVRRGDISTRDGNKLITFCNNSGPAFIVGAVGVGLFRSGAVGLALYAAHILAALVTGLFLSGQKCTDRSSPKVWFADTSLSRSLPEAIKRAALQMLTVCGFVVFFSVLTSLLDALGVFSAIYGRIAAYTGYELRLTRAMLTGILELGCGIGAMEGAALTPLNLTVCAFLIGFGGISVAMQTASVVSGTEIKISRHLAGRLMNACISAFIVYTISSVIL